MRSTTTAAVILLTLLSGGSLRAQSPTPTSAGDAELEEAKRCYRGARFEETIRRLEDAVVQLDRERSLEVRRIHLADAYLHLGLAHLALGQRTQAREAFREMLALDEEIQLDPDIYAPKVLELLEEARAQVRSAEPELVESPPDKFTARLRRCRRLLAEALGDPDWIPRQLLLNSECVVLLPGVKKLAFGVGGRRGKGAVVCHAPEGEGWAPPLMVSIAGASFGAQFGLQSADVVMLMRAGADYLLQGKLTLGGDVSAAFGPGAKVATDGLLDAQILTYARARGVFAGVSFEGAALRPDRDANRAVYGEDVDARALVSSMPEALPEAAYRLTETMREGSLGRIELPPEEPEAEESETEDAEPAVGAGEEGLSPATPAPGADEGIDSAPPPPEAGEGLSDEPAMPEAEPAVPPEPTPDPGPPAGR